MTTTNDIALHTKELIKYMTSGLYEKDQIMALALLSAIAGESIFLLGPPGTAKSMVARRLKAVFTGAKDFEYLMSRFSTPDEIFGPVSISKLKDQDCYERMTEGYLPDAEVVFLDEIWKAGPSIQNTLLTALNERIYKNGRHTLHIPLKALIAASNELPAKDEGLEALWDRFLVRVVSNCITDEKTFYKMVCDCATAEEQHSCECALTNDQLSEWQERIQKVGIPDEILGIVSYIRQRLKEESLKEDVESAEYYISDRRWKKVFQLMRTSAFLNGRNEVDASDTLLLTHCLWNTENSIPVVSKIISSAFFHQIEECVSKQKEELNLILEDSASNKKSSTHDEERFLVRDYLYYVIEDTPFGTLHFPKNELKHLETTNEIEGLLYYDDAQQRWVMHAIYEGSLFSFKRDDKQTTTRVKLKRFKDGIVIDDIPFPIKLKLQEGAPKTNKLLDFSRVDELEDNYLRLTKDVAKAKVAATKLHNLFVTSIEQAMLRTELAEIEMEMKRLNVKITNAHIIVK